jgi:hypothetical protein
VGFSTSVKKSHFSKFAFQIFEVAIQTAGLFQLMIKTDKIKFTVQKQKILKKITQVSANWHWLNFQFPARNV